MKVTVFSKAGLGFEETTSSKTRNLKSTLDNPPQTVSSNSHFIRLLVAWSIQESRCPGLRAFLNRALAPSNTVKRPVTSASKQNDGDAGEVERCTIVDFPPAEQQRSHVARKLEGRRHTHIHIHCHRSH